jgi:hypothetical protein
MTSVHFVVVWHPRQRPVSSRLTDVVASHAAPPPNRPRPPLGPQGRTRHRAHTTHTPSRLYFAFLRYCTNAELCLARGPKEVYHEFGARGAGVLDHPFCINENRTGRASHDYFGSAAPAMGCLDFRHTYGSQLAIKGGSLYKISTLMRNSPETRQRHYAALCRVNSRIRWNLKKVV